MGQSALRSALATLAIAAAAVAIGCGAAESSSPGGAAASTGAEPACTTPSRALDDGRCVEPGIQDNGCAAGTYARGDGTCAPAGLTAEHCVDGFVFDEDGSSCEPILPAERCPDGSMALPGDERCLPVSPCPIERWATLDGEDVQYVDATASGADADGSEAKPWPSIALGVAAAAEGAIVAIAGGSYAEDVVVDAPLRLWGRCAAEVEIVGSISVLPGADGTELRGVGVTGGAIGIEASGVADLAIDGVRVHDVAGRGIHVHDGLGPSSVAMKRVLVEAAQDVGLRVEGSKGALEDILVRGTAPRPGDLLIGRGIDALENRETGGRAEVTLKRALSEDNHTAGIFVGGSDAVIEGLVVRGTQPQGSNDRLGRGIDIEDDPETSAHGTTSLRGALVEENHDIGLFVLGSDADIEAVVVRSTLPRVSDLASGHGVDIQPIYQIGARPEVTMRASLVEASREAGVFVMAADVTFEGLLVRSTRAREADNRYGRGLGIQDDPDTGEPADVTMRGSVIEDGEEIGVLVAGSRATLDGVLVARTQPEPASSRWGYGVQVQYDPMTGARQPVTVRASRIEENRNVGVASVGAELRVEGSIVRSTQAGASDEFGDGIALLRHGTEMKAAISSCLLQDNARAGVSVFGSSATIEASEFRCNGFDLDLERYADTEAALADLADNVCGCDGVQDTCVAVSSKLGPPDPVAPDL